VGRASKQWHTGRPRLRDESSERQLPAAAVTELDLEMAGIETKHRDRTEHLRGSGCIVRKLAFGLGFCPAFPRPMTEMQGAAVAQQHLRFGAAFIHLEIQKGTAQ